MPPSVQAVPGSPTPFTLETLGYAPSHAQDVFEAARTPCGALIVAGTAGSGRTTTLHHLGAIASAARSAQRLHVMRKEEKQRVTFRETKWPAEASSQNEERTRSFKAQLGAALKGDPAILVLGELRNTVTVEGMKQATQGGLKVLATLHASSVLGIFECLEDFDLSTQTMMSPDFFAGLIYQKLFPLVCPQCAEPLTARLTPERLQHKDRELVARLQRVPQVDLSTLKVKREGGCETCCGSGYAGRTVCAETLMLDTPLRRLLHARDKEGARLYWRSLSDNNPLSSNMTGKTLKEHALLKMRQGLLSPYDVEDLLGYVDQVH